jgi:V8-like Glu-specific endopeptidase
MSITIKHLTGNLAEGQPKEQTFGDSVDTITFGRERDCQIVYAPEYTVVGKRHCQLLRQVTGDYRVNLLGQRYVEINGVPADNSSVVPNGATVRLGDPKDGPSFKVEIAKQAADLPDTRPQPKVKSWRESMTETRRLGTVAASVLALVIAGSITYFMLRTTSLEDQIAQANAAASARAQKEFSEATLARLEAAVYLVAKQEDQSEEAEGTAWAFAPNLLATNAHVTQAILGHEDEFFLVGPDGTHIKIKKVVSHPGYLAFGKYKTTQGTTRYGNFTPLDLINEYDVGIIEIDPSTPLPVDAKTGQPVTLELASDDQLQNLAPGTPVASVGFPVENLVGSATATKAPATLHFGFISSLTDVFMCRTDPVHRLLIQHSVPVTGGASGSPLIEPSGKVIGLVNGGNTTVFKTEESATSKTRMPSAALINFAQRVDLLRELAEGKAADKLAADETYWDKTAAQFDDYFQVAVKAFEDLAKQRYKVGEGEDTLMGNGVLDAGDTKSFKLVQKTFKFDAVPGRVYGFIADAEGGVPIGINVKKEGTDQFLRDAKDPRQSSELELAPTAWVTVTEPTTLEIIVWSLVAEPAKFALHAYSWEEPTTSEAPPAGSQPAVSQQ